MVTPGLLPEADDAPPPRWPLNVIIVALLGVVVWLLLDRPAPKLIQLPAPPPDPARIRALEEEVDALKKPKARAVERVTQGLQDFRSGRYAQAEACFLGAFPDGCLYLVLTGLARDDVRSAAFFLGRAMEFDPQWLRRVKPRDLFGIAEDYERLLKALEERAVEDVEARLLLAYLQFHEKGAESARALLGEAGDSAAARAFREAVDRP